MAGRTRWLWLAVVVAALGAARCTTDYVTGKRTFSLVSESQEIEMGREADPQIVAEYGLYDDPALQAYVDGIGQRIARVSHRPSLRYTIRVVDSPIVNAFALPGGYVYITRGILAHFNSEDELAGVMGHEIGHVVARHGAEQMSRAQLAGLGLQLGSVLSETFAKYAQFAGAGVGLLFLKFSREQESESDLLGVEYSTKLGYDSHRMADFFATLEAMRDEGGQSLPGFLSTHPDPGDRRERVDRLTEEWRGRVHYRPLNRTRHDYLEHIDGLVYGDDPRQGFVEHGAFYHPGLRFRFPVPGGWTVRNTASTVMVVAPEQAAFVRMTLAEAATPAAAADEFSTTGGVTVATRARTTINGMPAVETVSDIASEGGDLRVVSYFVEKARRVYVFHGVTSASDFGTWERPLRSVARGFDDVDDPAILDRRPERIAIARAPRAGTIEAVLAALGVETDRVEEVALLNGKAPGDRVEAGYWLKVVGR